MSQPASSQSDRNTVIETDITVYGATSFVAKHVLKYLIHVIRSDLVADADTLTGDGNKKLRITLGGRNKTKLDALKDQFSSSSTSSVPQDVFVADGSDIEGLKNMAKRSQVVLNCAGPYFLYSSLVVAACADVGCDYVDITGEVAWVKEMREKYGAAAKASGARIVSLCGYDSIPSDMAVYSAVQALRNGVSTVSSTSNVVDVDSAKIWHQMYGLPNGATISTAKDIPFNPKEDFFGTENGEYIHCRPVPYFLGDPLSLAHPENVRNRPEFQTTKNNMAKGEWWNQLLDLEPDFFYGVSLPFAMSAVNL
jgi:hypothetical protein